jgi:2,3-bisphosphoglycerate-independent phosphoglycerate mutase
MSSKKVALIIMDGWGHGRKDSSNAIYSASTPFIDSLYLSYPNTELLTSGEDVGLPGGQMGNSEVGHLNIGAGRVIYQDLVKINRAVHDHSFHNNEVLIAAMEDAKSNNKNLHFIGLVSDGGVHSHINHLKALCDTAKERDVKNVFIHAFTDGRDTDPESGYGFLKELSEHLQNSRGKIASLIGRYYSMDRDKRWERIKEAYDLVVNGRGNKSTNILDAIKKSYSEGITDEFIKPVTITDANGNPVAVIKENDVVICFNFRTDRCREITIALTQQDFHEQNMHRMNLHYVTLTNYDERFKNVKVVYDKDNLKNTFGEILAEKNKTQLRIAETEKYPHVTFFFSGGREQPFKGEERIMIPSPKVATYDLQPEMSAFPVTDAVCKSMETTQPDFICLNYANADMVGHTGDFAAVVKAVETVDSCVKKVVQTGLKNGYSFLITADHGNADYMINEDGSPNTAHTTNPVPLFLIDKEHDRISPGRLSDLAPTILNIMGIDLPPEITGKNLLTVVDLKIDSKS